MPLHKNKNWKYKNTFFLLASFVVLFLLSRTEEAKSFVLAFSSLGYVGIFITGMFFVSIFTVVPATVVLYFFAGEHSIFTVSLFAGLGGVLGDFIIFRYLKNNLFEELGPLFKGMFGAYVKRIFHTKYFNWILPIIGAIIIASPFPDEVGIGMMGLSTIKNWQFLAVTFFLNTLGIFILLSLLKV